MDGELVQRISDRRTTVEQLELDISSIGSTAVNGTLKREQNLDI
jgi:hypothetical protein